MKRVFLALSLLSAMSAAATAADMPVKAPPAAVVATSWTGFYVGANAGYGWGHTTTTDATTNDFASNILLGTAVFTGLPQDRAVTRTDFRQQGATGGFQVGYNWQVGRRMVLGVETDFNLSGLRGSGNVTTELIPNSTITQTLNTSQKVNWFGTARARLGFLATPTLLVYGTGGLAYGRVSQAADFGYYSGNPTQFATAVASSPQGQAACSTTNPPCYLSTSHDIRIGWSAGGGAEWLLNPHLSLKAEYMFVSLAETIMTVQAIRVPIPSTFNTVFRNDFQVVRAGLNYHF
jgi:outer membrane immunogenic protein